MKIAQKFGLASGLFSGILMLAGYYLGFQGKPAGKYAEYLGLFAFSLFIVLSIFYTREREMNSKIDFKSALRSGVITAALSALVTSLFSFVYCKWIDPEWMERLYPQMKPEEILKAKSISGLLQVSFFSFALATLMGSIISALFALVLKRE